MEYHNGPIMSGASDVYFVWYGCWTNDCGNRGSANTIALITELTSSIGGTPYFQLNHLYGGGDGQSPSGGLFYSGSIYDNTYSHGFDLTEEDVKDIVKTGIENFHLPQDPSGIYIVMTSADIASSSTGFCSQVGAAPPHGTVEAFGSQAMYGLVGNPNRCPSLEAPQFMSGAASLQTPNGDFAGDAMASTLARLLSNIVTDPYRNAWYDRSGLETADKCYGTFGQTYTTANGARANVRWDGHDYLIQQNWVNGKPARCAMMFGR
jgi:hypothetical protein